MARTDGQTHGGGSGPAKGTYAYAKSRNKDIDKLIKQRKGLKRGTKEYNAVQNEINKAYGKGPTTRPTDPKTTPTSAPKKEFKTTDFAGKLRESVAKQTEKYKPRVSDKLNELGKGTAKPSDKPAAKTEDKPAAGAKAVKSTTRRAERLRRRAAKRTERSDRRAAKFRPGGKKYVSEARLEREEARGLGPTARVAQYRRAQERTANRRDIRGERRAGRMELRAQKSEGRAALRAKSREAAEERKTTYSRAGGGKVYMKGGKMEEKYMKGGKMYKKGGTVAQGASKKDVRREKKQARKSGRKA